MTLTTRIVRWWRTWLHVVVPGLVVHELAHYGAATVVAADARVARRPDGRVVCQTAWRPETARWRYALVAFAPLIFQYILVAFAVVQILWMGFDDARLPLALELWCALNLALIGIPSRSDIALVRE